MVLIIFATFVRSLCLGFKMTYIDPMHTPLSCPAEYSCVNKSVNKHPHKCLSTVRQKLGCVRVVFWSPTKRAVGHFVGTT
ncbi:hypothetical protein BKA82DRAFT_2234082 [Pisolithus tinctorius]|nr:hypothetical protein BKA82DRAFT_2234082 [Pisolithus tinctorius]